MARNTMRHKCSGQLLSKLVCAIVVTVFLVILKDKFYTKWSVLKLESVHLKRKVNLSKNMYQGAIRENIRQCTLKYNCSDDKGQPRKDLDLQLRSFDFLNHRHSTVSRGGVWRPHNCQPSTKLIVIVPYRKRDEQLRIFINNLVPFLQTQMVAFRILIIEQTGKQLFNRALLLNIGYLEALKLGYNDCFIVHDVDHIPEDHCNLYRCSDQPRHLCVAMDSRNYRLSSRSYFGGGMALSNRTMTAINGFSNIYFGWGKEDDDAFLRLIGNGFKIRRYTENVAKYTTIKHKRETSNPAIQRSIVGNWRFSPYDGFTTAKYTVLNRTMFQLYTKITVKFEGPTTLKEAQTYYEDSSKMFENLLNKDNKHH